MSSVPSGMESNRSQSQRLGKLTAAGGPKHQDSILMYCSYFTYCQNPQKNRKMACDIQETRIIAKFNDLESKYPLFYLIFHFRGRQGI